MTPAAKPSSRKTIKPQGDVPSPLSKAHPSPPPTTTPATNSLDARNAAARPEETDDDDALRDESWDGAGRLASNSAPRR